MRSNLCLKINTTVKLIAIGCFFLSPITRAFAEDLWGIIEIGTKGVKASFLGLEQSEAAKIESEFDENRANFKYELKEKIEGNQGRMRKMSAKNPDVRIRDNLPATIEAVTEFRQILEDDHAVARENIFVVASSGVAALPHASQIKDQLTKRGFNPEKIYFLDAATECALTYRWIVPKARYWEALVVDVGSGNVKACYSSTGPKFKIVAFELLKYGTATFADLVVKEVANNTQVTTTFAQKANQVATRFLEPSLQLQMFQHPKLGNARRVYMLGGIVWATTTIVRPESAKAYWFTISPLDTDTLKQRIRRGKIWEINNRRIGAGVNVEGRQKVIQDELDDVKKVFSDERQLLAGSEILSSMAKTLRFPMSRTASRAMFFAGVGYEGWRYQFLLDRINGILVETVEK